MRLSLVVMAYKQEAFIRETVTDELAQDHIDQEDILLGGPGLQGPLPLSKPGPSG